MPRMRGPRRQHVALAPKQQPCCYGCSGSLGPPTRASNGTRARAFPRDHRLANSSIHRELALCRDHFGTTGGTASRTDHPREDPVLRRPRAFLLQRLEHFFSALLRMCFVDALHRTPTRSTTKTWIVCPQIGKLISGEEVGLVEEGMVPHFPPPSPPPP